jgi:hypothetical protein
MQYFLEYTTILKHRIPVEDDGKLGNPQLVSKFITETKVQKTSTHKPKKKEPSVLSSGVDEVITR